MKLRKLDSRGFEHIFVMVFIVLATSIIGTYLIVSSNAASRSLGVDISSPQCNRVNSLPKYKWGVVGLNGTGLDFRTNPCLLDEVRHFDKYALYVGANYPSHSCPANITAKQCGGKAAAFDINLAKALGLNPSKWWIDVEGTGPYDPGIPWSSPSNNSEFIKGMFYTLVKTNKPVGFYSTPEMWRSITGGLQLPSSSNWVATGIKGRKPNEAEINAHCNRTFGGQRTSLIQYINSNNIDVDIAC